jgi:hypothetical protein
MTEINFQEYLADFAPEMRTGARIRHVNVRTLSEAGAPRRKSPRQ